MAKKKSARGGFNMSAEIRSILSANTGMSGREVYEAMVAKFPNANINEGSCNVAFSNARRKLGLGKGGRGKVVRVKRPVATQGAKASAKTVAAAAAGAKGSFSLDAIRAACDLIAKTGGTEAAIGLLKSLQPLNG